jgi:glyoxalase family protein
MTSIITGLHHVTAFAGKPSANANFYRDVLGFRLVKKTVNFDDPNTYHLYYGDGQGSPGTLLTHFPHPMAARARHGGSEITDTGLAVPRGTLAWWRDHLLAQKIDVREGTTFSQGTLRFEDHDGMRFIMTEEDGAAGFGAGTSGYAEGGIPGASAILGVSRVTLRVPDAGETASFLTDVLGFDAGGTEGDARRLTLGGGGITREIDVIHDPRAVHERMGAGTVHHVAWRVPDDAAQARAAAAIRESGTSVTQVMDRQYFRSIYFRIPGGVIFEIATDGPGFAVDESAATLGNDLKLPPQYEVMRKEIEKRLERI